MDNRVYLSAPHLTGKEIHYIQEAFDENWISAFGNNVKNFEKAVCEYTMAANTLAISSGTAAIHLALKALGVGEGDIVFCSTLTFVGSCNPILYEKATPVFIDSNFGDWNMSPIALEKAFIKYKKANKLPKAVIVVNLYGQSAYMDIIGEICKKYDVPIIEDAAESLGATYNGKKSGTFGQVGIYSFNCNKIITTGGGGMLVADNEEIISKCQFLATQARDKALHYQHSEVGYNYRMNNISAGIGVAQVQVLEERINKKKRIYYYYHKQFRDKNIIEMMPISKKSEPNYWLSCAIIKNNVRLSPAEIVDKFEGENIEVRRIWKPMHMQPLFEKCDYIMEGEIDCARKIYECGICLPSSTIMKEEAQQKVVDILNKIIF